MAKLKSIIILWIDRSGNMDIKQIEEIISKDKIYINEPMSKYTSFKIGGPAECLIKIENFE